MEIIMYQTSYVPIYGIVESVNQIPNNCCQQLVTIRTENGSVNFIISQNTYVIDQVHLHPGMHIVAFYNANAPVPLIYPPQYQAEVIAERKQSEQVIIDYFDQSLTARSQALRINTSRSTKITTTNGQDFFCNLCNRMLIVFYDRTTRSIPPQTTPNRIIVIC